MSYLAALERLDAQGLELSPTAPRRKFDLAHMRTLAHALGDPQTRFPSVLIAGTNGKGSTAATLASIFAAAGLRTALYTSPHLTRVTERIRTTGSGQRGTGNRLEEISEEAFARLYFQVDQAGARLAASGELPHTPSYFETLTALAFLYFAEQQVDVAVLEVGLGGRLDATNIVEPLLSVITDIALDHQEYLGSTLREIAGEKAGILRPHGTLVTLPQHPEANQALGEAAMALDVQGVAATRFLPDAIRPGEDARTPVENVVAPNHYTLYIDGQPLEIRSPLAGQHQQRNLALAIAAAFELLGPDGRFANRTIHPHQAIEAGITHTCWPGRLQFVPPNLLLDVAHNPAGAWALRAALATLPDQQPRTLIFSCLRDKDLREMSQILFPLFDESEPGARNHLVLAPIDSPRAASLDSLTAAAQALKIPAHAAGSAAQALELARSLTPPGGLIVATGSVYLIGALTAEASPSA